ncbi:MAG: sugar transferase [Planctomycetes bacterium]|nr:sugar transferase [Planctomycetota bacterium]MBL7037659.1 sugar transferase [Pirellulaceae bacterium]
MKANKSPGVNGERVAAAEDSSQLAASLASVNGNIVDLWSAWRATAEDAFVAPQPYVRWQRAVDLVAATLLLIPGLPIIGLLVLLVRLTSRGPGIFRQIRVGRNGRVFWMYKIRTMRVDAEAGTGAVWAQKNDPRTTFVGKVLRKLHLDEFPQLFNVLKGDMSLVGPRPERPEFVPSLAEDIPEYLNRLAVRPGVTGLAQVNLDPDVDLGSVRHKLVLDLEYVQHGSLSMDARVVASTLIHLLGISGERSKRWMGLHRDVGKMLQSTGLDRQAVSEPPAPATVAVLAPETAAGGNGKASSNGKLLNAFTVDVEDYYQVSAFEDHIRRIEWDSFAPRVESNTRRLLALLDRHEVTATFFILGWVARRHARLVREIHEAGHEIGSHGYWHRLIYEQSPIEFRRDLRESRAVLTDIISDDVVAYRAPTFSITNRSLWALDILAEEGFSVDSSIFPIRHDRYGIPGAQLGVHTIDTPSGRIVECPPAVARYGRWNLPVGGGGYFRLFPLGWTIRRLKGINRKRQQPFVFYIHPWEVDPGQPQMGSDSWTSQFRHRVGLASTERKLERLLGIFRFGRLCDVIQKAGLDPEERVRNEDQESEELVVEV